jgi:hypothetical protein
MKTKFAMIGSIAVMTASLALSAMADSQPAPPAQGEQAQSTSPQEAQQAHFDRMKQRLTKHLQDKISWTQKRLDCVQNAQDQKALRACLHEHRHGKGDHDE